VTTNIRSGRPYRRLQAQVFAEETLCWLCGGWVDPSLPPNHDMARSVDHVVPLGRGGNLLDRRNARLAHRIHNSERGADVPAPPAVAFSREW
jgi:hypothetical protein